MYLDSLAQVQLYLYCPSFSNLSYDIVILDQGVLYYLEQKVYSH